MGQYGQYLMASPSEKLVVISMGQSYPDSADCRGGYNEAWMIGLVWGMLSPTLQPSAEQGHTAQHADLGQQAAVSPRAPPKKVEKQASSSSGIVGSCMCDCPGNLGFGSCFNIKGSMGIAGKSPSDCKVEQLNGTLSSNSSVGKLIQTGASTVCPEQGFTLQCAENQTSTRCQHTTLKPCGPVENMPSSFRVETCASPTPKSFSHCVWHSASCNFGQYYPEWTPSQEGPTEIIV